MPVNFDTHSSTSSKARQQFNRIDERFQEAVKRIVTTRQPVEDAGDVGKWQEQLDELNRAAVEDRIATALAALAALNPQLAKIIADIPIEQDQDGEQEEQDARLTTGKRGKKVFRTYTDEDVDCFPDIAFMVAGVLPTSAVSLLYGESHVGKTFFALDIANHIARGIPWLGRRTSQGDVLYIYAEGKLGLKPRSQAWRKFHNLPSSPHIRYIAIPVQFIDDREYLLNTIEEIIEQEGTPSLIVADTFSNCAIGVNQNDQMEVTRVLMVAHQIVERYGSHVMLVHHTNKQGSFNGTQSFKNHVDTQIELQRTDENGPILVHCEKQRDGAEKFDDFRIQLEPVDLSINPHTMEVITSCVVVASQARSIAELATEENTAAEQHTMLDILKLHKRLTVNKWIAACKDAGVSKRAFYTHIPTLKTEKKVTYEEPASKGKAGYFEIALPVEQETFNMAESEQVD